MELQSLEDLVAVRLRSIYSAEQQLADIWQTMIGAAAVNDLVEAFRQFHADTSKQVNQLGEMFEMLDIEPEAPKNEAMAGIAAEAESVASARGHSDVRDAALIDVARTAKHYEIASYGSLRALARQIGQEDAAARFQEVMDEESQTDQQLLQLMERTINIEVSGG